MLEAVLESLIIQWLVFSPLLFIMWSPLNIMGRDVLLFLYKVIRSSNTMMYFRSKLYLKNEYNRVCSIWMRWTMINKMEMNGNKMEIMTKWMRWTLVYEMNEMKVNRQIYNRMARNLTCLRLQTGWSKLIRIFLVTSAQEMMMVIGSHWWR